MFKIKHNMCTDCIPRSVALTDLCGGSKCIVHACHTYIRFATQSPLPYYIYTFFKIKTTNQKLFTVNFEILKQKQGKGANLQFNEKAALEKFRIRTIWNYLFNQAVNAMVKQFNGKEGKKAAMGWLHGEVVMNPVLMLPVLEPMMWCDDNE